MIKTLSLINEITCSSSNEISLVVICFVSDLCARAIPLEVLDYVSALRIARAHAHYFAR